MNNDPRMKVIQRNWYQREDRTEDPLRRYETAGNDGPADKGGFPGRAGGGRQVETRKPDFRPVVDVLRRFPGNLGPARGIQTENGPGLLSEKIPRVLSKSRFTDVQVHTRTNPFSITKPQRRLHELFTYSFWSSCPASASSEGNAGALADPGQSSTG